MKSDISVGHTLKSATAERKGAENVVICDVLACCCDGYVAEVFEV